MANLVITPSGGSAVTFLEMTAGCTGVAERYWRTYPRPQTPEYARHVGKGPGTAGMWVRRGNFNQRIIDNFDVLYVQLTAAACITAFQADVAAIMNKKCSLALPDFAAAFESCECELFEQFIYPDGRIIKPTFQGGMYRMRALMRFTQLRTTA